MNPTSVTKLISAALRNLARISGMALRVNLFFGEERRCQSKCAIATKNAGNWSKRATVSASRRNSSICVCGLPW